MFLITTHIVPQGPTDESFEGPAFKQAMKFAEGMEKIGKPGLYATAYSSEDTPFVLKIGRMSDCGYLSYLGVIQELGIDNPYLPRILDVKLFKYELDSDESPFKSFFVVKMEKLARGEFEHAWSEDGDTSFAQQCRNVRNLAARKVSSDELDPILEEAITVLHLAHEQALKTKEHISFDLHCGNFLLRGDQLVITDPLA